MVAVTAVGLGVVMSVVVPDRGERVCEGVVCEVRDGDEYEFVSAEGIERYLKGSGLYPVGKRLGEIGLSEIEGKIGEMSMVKEARCYFDARGWLHVAVMQRVPLYRVKCTNGDYYVDRDRKRMPTSVRWTAYVPVVSGTVSEEFATGELFDFMCYVTGESRWASAFTQVCVYPDNSVELIPRVGNFVVVMGELDRYVQKLEKLDVFMDRVYRYKSWGEYSVINLEYRDQVVCR